MIDVDYKSTPKPHKKICGCVCVCVFHETLFRSRNDAYSYFKIDF